MTDKEFHEQGKLFVDALSKLPWESLCTIYAFFPETGNSPSYSEYDSDEERSRDWAWGIYYRLRQLRSDYARLGEIMAALRTIGASPGRP